MKYKTSYELLKEKRETEKALAIVRRAIKRKVKQMQALERLYSKYRP